MMNQEVPVEFEQLTWNAVVQQRAEQLVEMALQEDLGGERDWTTWAGIETDSEGIARFVNRVSGTVAGLPLVGLVAQQLSLVAPSTGRVTWQPAVEDGARVEYGTELGRLVGSSQAILQIERTALNFLGRLSGIATLTSQFVQRTAGTNAGIYDTRKTTPGWRLLEKYAVRCGGGRNHRLGLYAAVMLKDNHLAAEEGTSGQRLRDRIHRTRQRLEAARKRGELNRDLIFEVEVDSLDQFQAILDQPVDIVLLDNMSNQQLRRAVEMRDEQNPAVQLEASGGVHLDSVADIAATGVDRISSGALTHSAVNWDVGLDWLS